MTCTKMCTHPRSSKLFSIESRSCNSYSDVSHRDASVNNTVRSIATRVNPNPNPNLNPTLTLTLTLTICRQLTICFLLFFLAYLPSLHCTLAMNKLRSVTTTAEYTQTVCPHYSALCPRKPGVLIAR